MKVVFNEEFYNSDYADDTASVKGRMESIVNELKTRNFIQFERAEKADYFDIAIVHDPNHIARIQADNKLYEMALLSAGAAIKAANLGFSGSPAFSCARPPGHHAYKNQSWGFCYFCNMAIALKYLKKKGMIKSAFVLDFDAHTGDGTIDCLKDWKEVKLYNPSVEREKYVNSIEQKLSEIKQIDIVAVSAGFDSYELDLGNKLKTFDFYHIGKVMKKFANDCADSRRFAVLEGGYYQPHLGQNVAAFLEGFE